jgi:RNA polymerase sigma factor (sigma-70 family)
MLCSRCGTAVAEGTRFCRKCGTPIAQSLTARTDDELEALAAGGNREAFAELYDRHFERVYDFLRRMVRDADEAADLAQETFLNAMRALSPKEKKASFSTWLFTIARNLALKRLQRRPPVAALPEREDEEPTIYQQVDPQRLGDPELSAQAHELSGLVWQAAAALNTKEYSLLDLHVRQGLDSAEIAQVMGVSKGNAYTMMSRLRDTFEGAVAALLLVQRGRHECEDLDRLLKEQRITVISPDARRTIDRHVAGCPTCREQRRRLVSPTALFGALAAVAVPLGLKPRIADALAASWAEAGTQAAGAGLKALLSQPAAKFASLPTAWKAALIGGLLISAIGAGLGGWIGLGGELPGGDDGETPAPIVQEISSPTPTVPSLPVSPTPVPQAQARIAFYSSREPEGLYLMNTDGTDVVRIGSASPDYAFRSFGGEWSPDGQKVALYDCPDSPEAGALYVMKADGTRRVAVGESVARCGSETPGGGFSWSPDSSSLVFYSYREPAGLYVVNADGTNLEFLTDGLSPVWSPLGDSILFIGRADGSKWEVPLFLIGPDGSDRRPLTTVPCAGAGLTQCDLPLIRWSPDGSRLALSAVPDPPSESPLQNSEIYVLRADGSQLTRLTNDPASDYNPIWVDCDVPTAGCEATVQSQRVDVLDDPRAGREPVGELSQGDSICLLGSPLLEDGSEWWPLHGPGAIEGWATPRDPADPSEPLLVPSGHTCAGSEHGADFSPKPTQAATPPAETTAPSAGGALTAQERDAIVDDVVALAAARAPATTRVYREVSIEAIRDLVTGEALALYQSEVDRLHSIDACVDTRQVSFLVEEANVLDESHATVVAEEIWDDVDYRVSTGEITGSRRTRARMSYTMQRLAEGWRIVGIDHLSVTYETLATEGSISCP